MAMLAYVLLGTLGLAVVIALLDVYTRRVADLAVTDQFRASESIVNGHIPSKWITQINRRMAIGRRLLGTQSDVRGTEFALAKLDRLHRFFEKSPLVATPEARELLLGQLQEMREAWAKMTWSELLAEYAA